MLDNDDLNNVLKSKYRQGFASLVCSLSSFVDKYEFIEYPDQICLQTTIQKNSYIFIERIFGEKSVFSICGKQMQMYLTKMDITEIELGAVDLSHPSFSDNINEDEAKGIIKNNDLALTFLKKPFSESFLTNELTESLSLLNKKITASSIEFHSDLILDFLNLEKKHLAQVILFCEVLNLVCISQSLYVFSYQIKHNQNFARMVELILRLKSSELQGAEHIEKLAERFFQIFIGNLAARVFNHQTLAIVEKALSTEATT